MTKGITIRGCSGCYGYRMSYALNILDLLFTLYALSHGAVELNPIMRNVPFMVFSKTVIIGALLWWLSNRRERLARFGLGMITVYYVAVVLWHIVNLMYYLGGAFA